MAQIQRQPTTPGPPQLTYWSNAVLSKETTPYARTVDPDSTALSYFQNITCMPAYQNLSTEELRLAHYFYNSGDDWTRADGDGAASDVATTGVSTALGPKVSGGKKKNWETAGALLPKVPPLVPKVEPGVQSSTSSIAPAVTGGFFPVTLATEPARSSFGVTPAKGKTPSTVGEFVTPKSAFPSPSPFSGSQFSLSRSSSRFRSSSAFIPEISDPSDAVKDAEAQWEDSRKKLATMKAALLKAKEEYDAALATERFRFKIYTEARRKDEEDSDA